MGLYADKILEMTGNIGKPTVTKSTTTLNEGDEGALDLSGLMNVIMMLAMKDMFKTPPNSRTNPTATNFATPYLNNPAMLPNAFMSGGVGYMPRGSNNLGIAEKMMAQLLFGKNKLFGGESNE